MGLFDIFNASKIKEENKVLKAKLEELKYDDYEKVSNLIKEKQTELDSLNATINKLTEESSSLQEQVNKLAKQQQSQTSKLARSKELYKSVEYCIDNFMSCDEQSKLNRSDNQLLEELVPDIRLKLHCMDVKSLKKAFNENEKAINKTLDAYLVRYTTKANKTIYRLMVIALRAELQNILYNLKYEKMDVAEKQVKEICTKYLQIASDGNASIAGTLTKFIGEIEYLFINSVKIEYNYYVKKEQARQEQLAIKEQMRQEAAERKALEADKKKIEKEENKYLSEIEKLKEMLKQATEANEKELNSRILELESQLADVIIKKEEIINLQNGKAGHVYIISNLGSFGENVFKIGMTRRQQPQERVDELGDASVPFKFDVHSFIFSDNAVELEHQLHTLLNEKRVNKVNLRKEFFYSSLDELEELVNKVDSTAEFTKTMLAEEFRQSQSSEFNYVSNYQYFDDETGE